MRQDRLYFLDGRQVLRSLEGVLVFGLEEFRGGNVFLSEKHFHPVILVRFVFILGQC